MQLSVLVSFVGTLFLLMVHLIDYALESTLRPMRAPQLGMPDEDIPPGREPAPFDTLTQYDRAA
jgi:hypothetical protein